MITEIPTYDDFFDQGKELFVSSWKTIIDFFEEVEYGNAYADELDFCEPEYWKRSFRYLSLVLSTIQHGVELTLKGIICQESPYLLIASDHSKWPKVNKNGDIEFSEFKTIDASKLLEVCKKVSERSFTTDFNHKYDEMRKLRNKIMHSVDKNIKKDAVDVLEKLLFMHRTLFPEELWIKTRSSCLMNEPSKLIGADEFYTNRLSFELELAINRLPADKVKTYFNVDKNLPAYYCPECYYRANTDGGFEHKLARFTSETIDCTTLYCPICNQNHEIDRGTCSSCSGHIMSKDGLCLECAH